MLESYVLWAVVSIGIGDIMTKYIVDLNKLTIQRNGKIEYIAKNLKELDIILKTMILGVNDTLRII